MSDERAIAVPASLLKCVLGYCCCVSQASRWYWRCLHCGGQGPGRSRQDEVLGESGLIRHTETCAVGRVQALLDAEAE